jgi:hypothetical protein
MPTARYVNQQRTGLQLRQRGAVQNVLVSAVSGSMLTSTRVPCKNGVKPSEPLEAFHTGNLLRTGGSNPHGEAEYPHARATRSPSAPKPITPTGNCPRGKGSR